MLAEAAAGKYSSMPPSATTRNEYASSGTSPPRSSLPSHRKEFTPAVPLLNGSVRTTKPSRSMTCTSSRVAQLTVTPTVVASPVDEFSDVRLAETCWMIRSCLTFLDRAHGTKHKCKITAVITARPTDVLTLCSLFVRENIRRPCSDDRRD